MQAALDLRHIPAVAPLATAHVPPGPAPHQEEHPPQVQAGEAGEGGQAGELPAGSPRHGGGPAGGQGGPGQN